MDFTTELNGHTLEYFDSGHTYLVDGVIVPSITGILKQKFGSKYDGIDKATLQRAADAGTAVHDAIQAYYENGIESDLPEVRNMKFLQKQYKFEVLANEVPVILHLNDEPIAAGRLDMVFKWQEEDFGVGLADIKRTSTLDRDYLAYQLNLYRIAYRQCCGIEADSLRGIHLRDDVRKFVSIPINEDAAWQLIHEYLEAKG